MNDYKEWKSISMNLICGTATQSSTPSILPERKDDKEVFWVEALIKKAYPNEDPEIYKSKDDSNGQSDVFIKRNDETKIGVQVTELTCELKKRNKKIEILFSIRFRD